MCLTIAAERNLLAGRTLVDTDTGHTNGPRGVADGNPHVHIVGMKVVALLHGLHHHVDSEPDLGVHISTFHCFVHRAKELLGLLVHVTGLTPNHRSLHLLRPLLQIVLPLPQPVLDRFQHPLVWCQGSLFLFLLQAFCGLLKRLHHVLLLLLLLGLLLLLLLMGPALCIGLLLLPLKLKDDIALLPAHMLIPDVKLLLSLQQPFQPVDVLLAKQCGWLLQKPQPPDDLFSAVCLQLSLQLLVLLHPGAFGNLLAGGLATLVC
mmetsp:Transcript_7219/g.20341  ORF Transcript_7219/g.20341 Transcript_7219/m.20341 type:complete len:262 (-) Transcript_7219:398-1183(-)